MLCTTCDHPERYWKADTRGTIICAACLTERRDQLRWFGTELTPEFLPFGIRNQLQRKFKVPYADIIAAREDAQYNIKIFTKWGRILDATYMPGNRYEVHDFYGQ